MLKPPLLLLLWQTCAALCIYWAYIVSLCVMSMTRTPNGDTFWYRNK